MKPYRERTTNDFCEHWYYSQASYKGDHELLGYQPFEEGEGRDVNNGNDMLDDTVETTCPKAVM